MINNNNSGKTMINNNNNNGKTIEKNKANCMWQILTTLPTVTRVMLAWIFPSKTFASFRKCSHLGLYLNLQAAIGLLQRRKKQRKKQNLRFVVKHQSKLLCPAVFLSIISTSALIHASTFRQIENVCKNIVGLETKCVVNIVGGEAEEEAEVFGTLGES